MRIAVLIKQVPAVDSVRIDEETGTMEREGVESELNPLDLYAVEAAARIKEAGKAESVTAITMGPPQARRALSHAIAMACDDGVLLSDAKFAGADTLATARTIAAAIKRLGKFGVILAGERATDGETGQVPPSVAELLGIPALTYVSRIVELTEESITVRRAVDGGYETVRAPLPVLLSVTKEINKPRLSTLAGKLRAKRARIDVLRASDIEADGVGLAGSPTRVVKVMYPKVTRTCRKISMNDDHEGTVREAVKFLADNSFSDARVEGVLS
ncbi:electron transfer flavoprotein subunit beta [Synergistales bacterium]|nr:electron transfer flavoprotein subunit beta [Synergistales bacterium]